VSAVLAGHLARARELLAEPSRPGLFDLASRVGKLEAVLALICDAAEGVRNPAAQSYPAGGEIPHPDSAPGVTSAVTNSPPGGGNVTSECDSARAEIRQALTDSGAETAPVLGQSRVVPPCPECAARARRDVRWTGALPSGGDSWACGGCGSTWATPGTEET